MNQIQHTQSMNIILPDDIYDLSGSSNIDSTGLLAYQPQNRISIKGKLFTLNNADGTNEPASHPMDVVILNVSKFQGQAYHIKGFSDTESTPPDCSSANGEAPDPWITTPQANNCKTCQWNQQNSGKDGRGKACKVSKLIAVLPSTKTNPPIPYVLRLPVTSMIPFRGYVTELTKSIRLQGKLKDNKSIAPLELFVTSLSFKERDQDGKAMSHPQLEFKYKSIAPREMWEKLRQLSGSEEVKKMLKIDDESIAQHRFPTDKSQSNVSPVSILPKEEIPFGSSSPIIKEVSASPKIETISTKDSTANESIENIIDAHLAAASKEIDTNDGFVI